MSSYELRFFPAKKEKKKQKPNKWGTIKSLVHKIRLHGRRGKGTAGSFSREKLRQAPQKEGGEILSYLPPGLPRRLVRPQKPDVQNKWDDKTHTHTYIYTLHGFILFLSDVPAWRLIICILKKNLNAPRPSEHPPVRGKKCQNV